MAEQTIGTARIDITASAEGVEAAAAKAKRSISDLSKDAQIQYDRLTAAERRRVDALNRQVDTLGMTRAEQLAYNASLRTSGPLHDELVRKLKQQEAAQKAANSAMLAGGLSAKEMDWAMRGVPAQITDIVTSLQGGQRPLTVFIQQGGQLKDMFGGVVPAAKALTSSLIGMVNPYTVVAAAAAGLAFAYHQGSSELDEFNHHLTMTGGALGMSASQVSMLAVQMDRLSGITRGGAVRALTEVAASGKIAADQIGMVAEVALRSSQLLGRETADVVEEFAKLAGEPSKAAAELNEKYNFLTTSVYQQIRALEEQGRTQDAARLAADELGRVTTERLSEVERSLGSVEKAWRFVKDQAKGAWDAMLNVGRPDTLNDQLKEAVERLETLRVLSRTSVVGDPFGRVEEQERRVAAIRAQIDSEQEALGLDQARAESRKAFIEAEQRWQEQTEGFLSKSAKMEKEIAQARADGLRLKKSEHEIEQRIADIREKYSEKSKGGISTTQTELARLNALMEAERQREEALHSVGLAQANLNEGERLAIQYAEKLKLATDEKTKSQLAANKALAEEYGARKRANDVFEKDLKDRQSAIDAAKRQTERLRDEIETYGMGKSAIEAMTIARLEEKLAIDSSLTGDQRHLELLRQEIEERQKLLGAMRTKEALDAQLKEWQNWEREVDRIFDQLGQSLTDQLFEGGKSARDMLKDMFKALTLRIVVQPMLSGMQGMVTNQIGGLFGYQDPRQQQGGGGLMGMAKNASSAHSALTGGPSSMFGNAAQWLGKQVGSEALSAFGMGMSGAGGIAAIGTGVGASLGTTIGTSAAAMTSTTFSAALGGTAGVASGSGVVGSVVGGGAAGLGSAFAAALPWVGGALALGSAFGLFDSGPPKTRHGQRTTIDYTGGAFGVSALDDRQAAGSEQAALAAAQSAVAAANDLFARIGVNAGIESFYAIMESSVLGDRNGVASGGTLRIGDTLRQIGVKQSSDMTLAGFGGWSSEDMLSRLQTDITLTTLEAFQALGDQLPSVLSNMLAGIDFRNIDGATAQDIATRFAAVADGASQFLTAIEAMPFEQLRGLSFDAAAGLVQLAGGVESLLGVQQTYYQAFYSEAERHGIAVNNLTSALAAAGVVMPELVGSTDQMLASYRAIVEAQDLNTEAGRQVYVALMQASGAFADVAQFAGQAAEATRAAAQRAAEEEARIAKQRRDDALSYLAETYNAVVQAGQREIARLQESFGATDSAMSAYRSAVQRLESELNSLFSAIDRGIQALRGTGAAFDAQYHQARAVISTTLLTGQLPQTADLSEAIRVAQQGVMGQRFASREDQQRAYLTLANELEAIKGIAEPELDAAQATLAQLEDQYRLLRGMSLVGEDSLTALEQQLRTAIATEESARRQISAIEEQINWAKEQYNALLEIRDGVLSFPEALAAFAQTLAAAIAAGNRAAAPATPSLPGGGPYTPVPGTGIGSSSWTTDYLYANQDVLKAYDASWGLTPEAWAQYHWDTYGKYEGRSYDVGTNYVPRDMLANIHEGEIIIDPRSSDILRRYGIGVQGGGSSRETEQLLREQLSEVRQQNRYLYEIVKSGKRTANNTEDVANAIAHGDSDCPTCASTL